MIKFILIYLLLLPVILMGQENYALVLKDSLVLDAFRFVGVDSYGAIYSLQTDGALTKHQNNYQYRYYNQQLGSPDEVDLLHPLVLTLFYKKFNMVIQLDNTLNETGRFDFNGFDRFREPIFVSTGPDKSLWIFDQIQRQVELFNYKDQTFTANSSPITDNVLSMVANFNYCWLLSQQHLYQFNIYGSQLHDFSNRGWEHLWLDFGTLLLIDNDQLYLFRDGMQAPAILTKVDLGIKQLCLLGDSLYIYNGKHIKHFLIKHTKDH